jgi:two-component system NarL family response regulator
MNICIVEDNESLLENLRLLLDGEPGMSIIGHYKTAEEALRATPWKKTHILLVDLDLPGMSGVELIRQAGAKNKDMRIIVYTIHEARPMILDAIKAGAKGFLIKPYDEEQVMNAFSKL